MEKTVKVTWLYGLPSLVLLWKLLVCCSLVVRAGATSVWVSHERCKTVDLETALWFCSAWKQSTSLGKRRKQQKQYPQWKPLPHSCPFPGYGSSWHGEGAAGQVETMWRESQSICASSWLGWQCWQKVRDSTKSFYSVATSFVHLCPLILVFLVLYFFLIHRWCVCRKFLEGRPYLCKYFSWRANAEKKWNLLTRKKTTWKSPWFD